MSDDLDAQLDQIRTIRRSAPSRVAELAAARVRRPMGDGNLLIIAADHSARGVLGVRYAANAMASRTGLLRRLLTALSRPGVDGLLATPDIVEDLLMLGALDNKLVFGSMNRGGVQGASFELDDRFTAFDVPSLQAASYDGGKMLCRIDLEDPGSVATLEACGQAISALAAARMPAMVEPFMCYRTPEQIHNDLSADGVIKSIHIAQGLGNTSAYTWLKVPVVQDMHRVLDATTLPTLLLGGDPTGSPDQTYANWGHALKADSARGLVVGRSLLFPQDDDVAAAVDIAAELVHG